MTGPRERFRAWLTAHLDARLRGGDPEAVAEEIRVQAAAHGITWEEAMAEVIRYRGRLGG